MALIVAFIPFLALLVAHVLIMDVGGSGSGSGSGYYLFDVHTSLIGLYTSRASKMLQEEHNKAEAAYFAELKEREVPKEDDTLDWEEDFETHIKVCREEADPRHHRGRRDKHPKWMRVSALRSREVMC
jgi:hypothetical protein